MTPSPGSVLRAALPLCAPQTTKKTWEPGGGGSGSASSRLGDHPDASLTEPSTAGRVRCLATPAKTEQRGTRPNHEPRTSSVERRVFITVCSKSLYFPCLQPSMKLATSVLSTCRPAHGCWVGLRRLPCESSGTDWSRASLLVRRAVQKRPSNECDRPRSPVRYGLPTY